VYSRPIRSPFLPHFAPSHPLSLASAPLPPFTFWSSLSQWVRGVPRAAESRVAPRFYCKAAFLLVERSGEFFTNAWHRGYNLTVQLDSRQIGNESLRERGTMCACEAGRARTSIFYPSAVILRALHGMMDANAWNVSPWWLYAGNLRLLASRREDFLFNVRIIRHADCLIKETRR